jgi:hypothetical protein
MTDLPPMPDLDVVLTLAGYETAERILHSIFREHTITGEWFRAEPVIRWVARFGYVYDKGINPGQVDDIGGDILPLPMQRLASERMDWFSSYAIDTITGVGGWGARIDLEEAARARQRLDGRHADPVR